MPIPVDENKIIYFEDVPKHRKYYGDALREEGYDVREYSSATTCLEETSKENAPNMRSPAAAVVDLVDDNYPNPQQAGLDIIRQLRERWPYMHIVALSALSDQAMISEAGQAYKAVGEYIVKNVADDIAFLKSRLKVHIAHYLALCEIINDEDDDDDIVKHGRLHSNIGVTPIDHTLDGKPLEMGRTASKLLGLLALQPDREIEYDNLRQYAGIARLDISRAEDIIEGKIDANEAVISDYESRADLTEKELKDIKRRRKDRESLSQYAANPNEFVTMRAEAAVRQQIANIRNALCEVDDDFKDNNPIISIPGVGYLLNTGIL